MSRAGPLSPGLLLATLASAVSFARSPFPATQEEKEKAGQIQRAVEAGTQPSVATLAGLLRDDNPRVQTAALLGIMRLANAPLDFSPAVAPATALRDAKPLFAAAAADVALVVLDKQTPVGERRAQLVKLAQSKEGRDRAAFALGRIQDEGTAAPLKAALSDADQDVEVQAAAQLARKALREGEPILLDALGEREGAAGNTAVGAMAFVKDQSRLAVRLAALLGKQAGEEQLAERSRTLLDEARNRVLRELATWDTEKLRPLAPALKPVSALQRRQDLAQALLKKLGD